MSQFRKVSPLAKRNRFLCKNHETFTSTGIKLLSIQVGCVYTTKCLTVKLKQKNTNPSFISKTLLLFSFINFA